MLTVSIATFLLPLIRLIPQLDYSFFNNVINFYMLIILPSMLNFLMSQLVS